MRNLIIALVLFCTISSCADHGKRIQVEGTETEIYYKGDGVTESDAKKTADLLKARFIKSNDKKASIQITNDKDVYTIRFVYDEEIYKTLKNVDNEFKALAVAASQQVFNGKKVNIALADDHFKDWKTIPYDENFAKSDETGEVNTALQTDNFDHERAGDVDFFWSKNIPDEEAKRIADYIVMKGDFSGGNSELIITNENGKTIIRFTVKNELANDPQTMATIEPVAQDLKEKLFPDAPFSFYVTDQNRNVTKSWDF
jgi:hypothetical protein